MAKYLPAEGKEGYRRAETAFRQALDLNPDLTIAHKFYAQLEVDLGRAKDAMTRLLSRARGAADPEVFAGLGRVRCVVRDAGGVSRGASASGRAGAEDSAGGIPPSWFLQHDYAHVASMKIEDNPYIVAVSMMETGRKNEALPVLRALEDKVKTRMGDFIKGARTLIEGDEGESVAAIKRVLASEFSDPEGLFYVTRHLARLQQGGSSRSQVFGRVVEGARFFLPACDIARSVAGPGEEDGAV